LILFSFREFETFRANIEARILPNNRSDRPYLIYDDYSDNNKDFLHYTDFYKAPPKGYNDRKALCQIKITIGNKEIADLLKP
jgi:hypothetical protein